MYSVGISVVQGASRLARRSRPLEAGELARRVKRISIIIIIIGYNTRVI